MNSSILIGQYELVSHGTYDSEGNFSSTSDSLHGCLTYGRDLELFVLIHFADVPDTTKELLSYCGTYEVQSSSIVVHKISLCSQPHRNNTDEIRTYRFENGNLVLSAELPGGRNFEAVWKKRALRTD